MREPELTPGQLPGQDLIEAGVADLKAGRTTVASCLVEIARSRLTQAGVLKHSPSAADLEPELRLYRLLRAQGGDAYSRYNALLRELVSFEQALDRRRHRQQ